MKFFNPATTLRSREFAVMLMAAYFLRFDALMSAKCAQHISEIQERAENMCYLLRGFSQSFGISGYILFVACFICTSDKILYIRALICWNKFFYIVGQVYNVIIYIQATSYTWNDTSLNFNEIINWGDQQMKERIRSQYTRFAIRQSKFVTIESDNFCLHEWCQLRVCVNQIKNLLDC